MGGSQIVVEKRRYFLGVRGRFWECRLYLLIKGQFLGRRSRFWECCI